jgi:hypothetical protein
MDRPMTRYATTDDGVSIAYQVVGEGPIDLVFVHAFVRTSRCSGDHG